MDDKNGPESGYRHDVSPYLLRPLRSYAEACRDIAALRQMRRRAQQANDNFSVFPVAGDTGLRRGDPIRQQ